MNQFNQQKKEKKKIRGTPDLVRKSDGRSSGEEEDPNMQAWQRTSSVNRPQSHRDEEIDRINVADATNAGLADKLLREKEPTHRRRCSANAPASASSQPDTLSYQQGTEDKEFRASRKNQLPTSEAHRA